MISLQRSLALLALTATLAGCGHGANLAATSLAASATRVQDDAAVAKIVGDVLSTMFAASDTNKDGAISKSEYAAGRSSDAVSLFFSTFDADHDGNVTQAEYTQAGEGAVAAYQKYAVAQLAKSTAKYQSNFNAAQLRVYLTTDLGLTGDYPLLFKLMGKLDLNKSGKLEDAPGEADAFTLMFIRQQLQHSLALPVSPLFPA